MCQKKEDQIRYGLLGVEMMSDTQTRQFTFPRPMICTHIYPDGREEQVKYGHFESILIVAENGWEVYRTKILTPPQYLVTELTKVDGTKVVSDEGFCLIHEDTYADGRKALNKFGD